MRALRFDKPGDCPVCNMHLVTVGNNIHHKHTDNAAHPGHAKETPSKKEISFAKGTAWGTTFGICKGSPPVIFKDVI